MKINYKLPQVGFRRQQALFHYHGSSSEEVRTPAIALVPSEMYKALRCCHQFCISKELLQDHPQQAFEGL